MSRNYSKNYNFSGRSPIKSRNSIWRTVVKFVYIVLPIIIIVFGVYFFIFSDFFKIKEIVVRGNSYVVSAAIVDAFQNIFAETKLLFLKNNNLNILNSQSAEQEIKDKFPRIEEVSIEKQWPDKIIVVIKEKEAVEILCKSKNASVSDFSVANFSDCFFIDKNGIAFDRAADTQGFLILKILDNRGVDIGLDKKSLNTEFLNFVRDLKNNFDDYLNYNIKLIVLDHSAQREVSALIDNWRAIFDVSGDAKKQLFVLREVLEKEVKDQKDKLDYIDLRVEGRAYYKLK
ncbi:MAG: hypothetical protein US71_C0001G0048 [Parcubacteria group bacterium GW2011_GWD2_38_12]|nr:MAG: hypothetical protein US06_C0001G0047 [Parcubacteria group bacterium GW2011_GWC2_36_17]KKQ43915.1 MAG: hypothetical protein US61_C0001G0028 [Parcubacteria group bacterium GW2011_GWE2_37_8]KKQ52845.1 MAG: hypothetical protein US71_C0001G0048 [Parcubacteria group bacterium GW2011_GWD2_38_12]KKQ59048.1 MAG: hypothetical protein US79_C0001G0047 [Parcubacteria group bacterium GW2011_GWC1_38_17]KKQ59663.1 MAG: hypothetical protein US78_C0001G0023 [Parcubacteria group bacterium GW2011_GWD1_38_1